MGCLQKKSMANMMKNYFSSQAQLFRQKKPHPCCSLIDMAYHEQDKPHTNRAFLTSITLSHLWIMTDDKLSIHTQLILKLHKNHSLKPRLWTMIFVHLKLTTNNKTKLMCEVHYQSAQCQFITTPISSHHKTLSHISIIFGTVMGKP